MFIFIIILFLSFSVGFDLYKGKSNAEKALKSILKKSTFEDRKKDKELSKYLDFLFLFLSFICFMISGYIYFFFNEEDDQNSLKNNELNKNSENLNLFFKNENNDFNNTNKNSLLLKILKILGKNIFKK